MKPALLFASATLTATGISLAHPEHEFMAGLSAPSPATTTWWSRYVDEGGVTRQVVPQGHPRHAFPSAPVPAGLDRYGRRLGPPS